jgi:hypothetical protein
MTEEQTKPVELEVDFEALAAHYSFSSIPGKISTHGKMWACVIIKEEAEAIARGVFEGRLSGYSKPRGALSRIAHLVSKYEEEQRALQRSRAQQRRQQSCEEQRQRRNDDSANRPPRRRTMPRGAKRGRPAKLRHMVGSADVLTWEQENGRVLFADAPQQAPECSVFPDDLGSPTD